MYALKCASTNLFQIQIILVHIPAPVYNFKIKIISNSLNIFSRKHKRRHVYLHIPYDRSSYYRGYQTITTMNHCCCCFNGLWKVKTKYIVLCLNVFAKLQKAIEASCHPDLLSNCRNSSHMLWPYQSTKRFISPFQVVCKA